jgi:hypothetical protein
MRNSTWRWTKLARAGRGAKLGATNKDTASPLFMMPSLPNHAIAIGRADSGTRKVELGWSGEAGDELSPQALAGPAGTGRGMLAMAAARSEDRQGES